MLLKGLVFKGILVQKAVVTGAAALVAVSAVGTAVKLSADHYVAAPSESGGESLSISEEAPAPSALAAQPIEQEALAPAEEAFEETAADNTAQAAPGTPAPTRAAATPTPAVGEVTPAPALAYLAEPTPEPTVAAPAEALVTPAPGSAVAESVPTGQPAAAIPVASEPTPAPVVETPAPVQAAAPTPAPAVEDPNGRHTTSIYTNDESTLLRVEYYDDNNHLYEYSSVSDYDKETNSYTETVYQYDNENQQEVVVRTDTYVNGELTSSENP